MEANLHSPDTENKDQEKEAAQAGIGRQPWNPIKAFLRLPTFEGLRFREYRLLWTGFVCLAMGLWMDQVARGWLIYELTNSTVQLGLVRGIQALPILLLSPIAGSMADRYGRKMQMMIALSLDGVMYAALAILIFTGLIQPWHVYVTALGSAIVQTFHHPSRAAMIADAVPPSHLTNAIGLNSIAFNVSRSTAPALAGVIIARFGTGGSFAVQAVLYLMATWATLLLRLGRSPAASSKSPTQREAFGRSIVEGWRFSWKNEKVRAGLLVVMFAALFITPFTTLLPVFARDILGVGATGQGLLLTGMGLGALCSAVLIATVGDRLPRGMVMLVGVALYGISVAVFAASPWFRLSIVLMLFVGLFHVTSHALVQTVVQANSPTEFRGRTMAIFQQNHFMMTIGSMLIGTLASLWGAQWALVLMSTLGTLAMLLISIILPGVRHIK